MSGLFSKPSIPAPQAAPVSPAEDKAAEQARVNVANAAAMDLAIGGRRSTEFAGRKVAMAAQMARSKGRHLVGDEGL